MGEVMRLRSLLCGVVLIGVAGEACAADMPDFLRGSQTVMSAPNTRRWDGVYVGGQASYSMASTDFTTVVNALVSFALRNSVIQDQVANFTTLSKQETTNTGFGGFVGYNWQFDQAIVGVEGNYTHTSLFMSSSDSLSRSILNDTGAPAGHDYTYNMTVTGTASAHLTDFGTFRVRGGYDAGMFMPYMFGGLAVGRADVVRSATVTGTLTDSFTVLGVPQSVTSGLILPGQQIEAKTTYLYGWTAGLGLDMCVYAGLFVRAEWEWVQFAPINGINLHTNTVRTAIAYKF